MKFVLLLIGVALVVIGLSYCVPMFLIVALDKKAGDNDDLIGKIALRVIGIISGGFTLVMLSKLL